MNFAVVMKHRSVIYPVSAEDTLQDDKQDIPTRKELLQVHARVWDKGLHATLLGDAISGGDKRHRYGCDTVGLRQYVKSVQQHCELLSQFQHMTLIFVYIPWGNLP